MKKGACGGEVPILGPRRVIVVSVHREETDASKTNCSGFKADTRKATEHSNDAQH